MMHHGASDSAAVFDGERILTWAGVREIVNRAARALLATDLDVTQRCAVFAENSAEVLLAHLAALYASASSVPCNFHLNAGELAYILADSNTRLLFVDETTAERGLAAARLVGVDRVIGWRCAPRPGLVPWEEWMAAASAESAPTDLVPRPSLLYTSGTTGRPKGVESPPTSFAGGATVAEHLERLATSRFAAAGGPHLAAGPLYHAGPLLGSRSLAVGVPVVIPGRFDPERILAAIDEHQITSTVMVPTHFVRLLKLDPSIREKYDVASLRFVMQTGSACPVDVKRAMIDWWGPVFWESYGATEMGTVCLINSAEWLAHPGSVGRPVPPFVARVLDEKLQPVPPGHTGLLYFEDTTGRGIVYHNRPEAAADLHIAPGVFTLGEIGHVDDDGFVYITDRASDLVVSGGVNIYPAESEQVLITHHAVTDVSCIGVPDPEMGERLVALVVRRPDVKVTEAELVAYCRGRLTHYKCPREVQFVDTLGRTAAGKVNKRTLRDEYCAAR